MRQGFWHGTGVLEWDWGPCMGSESQHGPALGLVCRSQGTNSSFPGWCKMRVCVEGLGEQWHLGCNTKLHPTALIYSLGMWLDGEGFSPFQRLCPKSVFILYAF